MAAVAREVREREVLTLKSVGWQRPTMNEDRRRILRLLAAQSAFVVALIHVGVGAVEWSRWLGAGFLVPRDLRWPVFVVSGLAVVGGIYLGSRADARTRRRLYAAGIVVMAGYVVGYFLWHLTGHRPLLVLGAGAGTESVSVSWFLAHLFAGPTEFASILFETLSVVLLTVLLGAGRGEHQRDGN
jgi:hypothetical protein